MNKPFNWYGGKEALAPLLVSLLPRHQVYVEVFGGSGALLFAKPKSRLEVFNDLDSGVVNFFRVLRTPEQARALSQALHLTPYSRQEYSHSLKTWQQVDDPVERARQWYVAVMMSMNSSIKNTGWSCTKAPGSNPARAFVNNLATFGPCTDRLREVQIDHRDFEHVLRAYDSPDTCFYLDPPYVQETRRKGCCYHHEMGEQDHQRMLTALQQLQGMVLLSGYRHPLYEQALTEWDCVQVHVRCSSAVRAQASREMGHEWTRTECIWRNPACLRASASLFAERSFNEEVHL